MSRHNDAGQLTTQLSVTRREGMDTMTVHTIGGQEMTYELLKALREDHPDKGIAQLFHEGYIQTETRPTLVSSRAETYRYGMGYDVTTGFLTDQTEMTSGDQSPGVTQTVFKDASYSVTGQLMSSRTVSTFDLFGMEESVNDVYTVYTRAENGVLRFADGVGVQTTSDLFGNSSASSVNQYFLGIGGQARMVSNASSGVATELDGSQYSIGQRTTYCYDGMGNLVDASGSSRRVGTDIFLNYQERFFENVYVIINGQAQQKLSYSVAGPAEVGPPGATPPPTYSAVGGEEEEAAAGQEVFPDFLRNPADYDKVLVAAFGHVSVYKYMKKSDGSLAGATIDIPGDRIILKDIKEIKVEGGVVTIDSGSGVNKARHVVEGLAGGEVRVTRYTFTNDQGMSDAPIEAERIVSVQEQNGTVTTTTHTEVKFEDKNSDGDTNDPGERSEKTGKINHAVGLLTVSRGFVNGQPSGTVTISGAGYSGSVYNVTGVTLADNSVTLRSSGMTAVVSHGPEGTTVTRTADEGQDPSQNQSVTIQRRTRTEEGNEIATLLTVVRNHRGQVTRAYWMDEASRTVWLTMAVAWDDQETEDPADDPAKLVVHGSQGYTIHYA